MPLNLLKHGLGLRPVRDGQMCTHKDLRSSYDIVIIGGGGHGLATAYYLAKNWNIRNVAVLEKSYLASGNTARNTAIIRSNYLTPEGVKFYAESVRLYEQLSEELDYNILYSKRGHLTLAHTTAALRTSRWRAEINKQLGVDSELVYPDEIAKICPQINLSRDVRLPILGALYHPPGAIARHDAVAWGYARRALEMGVEIHTHTEVTGVEVKDGQAVGVTTNRGAVKAGKIVQAVAGWSSQVADMIGLKLPIKSVPLQACVTEPVKPFLDSIVVSGSLSIYVSQSARGELVMGSASDPYPLYSTRSTLDFKEALMVHLLDIFPFIGKLKILRQWAGIADMTPDFSPIMGETPIGGYYIDAGWGTWGFKATPVCGKRMAETLATGKVPDILKPFCLERFNEFQQVGERGAASVGY